ncbi:MAG: phosphoglycerol geranylgeranyltransferase [Flavobacteriales bacterium]
MRIYSQIIESKKKGRKLFSILIDPDKQTEESLLEITKKSKSSNVDLFFVGGSLLTNNSLDSCISIIKQNCKIPVVLFPGNAIQINDKADGILFLSLISGRNPEMLIGNHVITAPFLKESDIEVLSTGYMLIDSGKSTSVSYMSNTTPIPHDKNDIAVCTAIAGEMLGLKMIYMDSGSGAINSISGEMITSVAKNINVPLIVGGGINSAEIAKEKCNAGADIIVVGDAIEKNSGLIKEISDAIHSF